MVAELKAKASRLDRDHHHAKHGQSRSTREAGEDRDAENTVVTNAGVDIAQSTDDDIALMWLKNQSQVTTAVNALLADKAGPTPPRSSPSCPDRPWRSASATRCRPQDAGPHRPAGPRHHLHR